MEDLRRSDDFVLSQDGAQSFTRALDEDTCLRLKDSIAAAELPRRRRVLQVDYSADLLPGCLVWRRV